MKIFIESCFFLLKNKSSTGLISALKLLADSGAVLYTNKSFNPDISRILKNEGIKISSAKTVNYDVVLRENNKRAEVNGNIYSNIKVAVESLLNVRRVFSYTRSTKETKVDIKINLDGSGKSKIRTGIGFFDHMLDQISRHGNIDLSVRVKGDLHIDEHHTVEDTGIALGESINKALGDKRGIKRYGFMLPMDDTIAQCAMDIGGRNYLNFKCKFTREQVGGFPTELTKEFFKGLAMGLNCNLYIRAEGENDHHKIEAMFKAFAKTLNEACRIDERAKGALPTTKGLL